ncbi:MAG: ribbon-helix-helix domain-containing protein [Azospirillaceae bacterium]|nr:ribbon-helix-helix domain-containing protein [Azospirillaceae bacterium]
MNSRKFDPDPLFHPLETRNIVVCGHRTSIKLEPYLWQSLEDIAERENLAISQLSSLVKELAEAAPPGIAGDGTVTLTSMIRVFILLYYRGRLRRKTDATGSRRTSLDVASDADMVTVLAAITAR